MKKIILCILLIWACICLLANVVSVSADSPALISSYWDETPNSWNSIWAVHPSASSARSAHGQAFTVVGSYRITSAEFWLQKNVGNPNALFIAVLYEGNDSRTMGYNVNPEYPWNPLATSNSVNISGIGSPAKYNFTFSASEQYTMTAGYYCITLECQSAVLLNDTNCISFATNLNGAHEGNRISYFSDWWYSFPTYDSIFRVYGEPIPDWIGIASPYAYAAITIMSISLIIGVGAVFISSFQTQDMAPLIPVIIIGIGIMIALFIVLPILNAFMGM